ncbi:MAG: hypothetical protein A2X55_03160 [Nitrospirae bacterium GWB2_47_37]|nr:MAG: hypothetical protein A2Z82_01105 [Nitrospirae bacterium GWA2_46_11]OGW25473.1 MAG: hypothetical protein A2X55_03160 [Nitrospirae bacterium GWB2_47_37]
MFIILLLSGCATFGPGPTDIEYSQAVNKLPVAKSAVYLVQASWYPNSMLDGIMSFHNAYITGTLFLTQERMVFATYDGATNTFLQGFAAAYSDISWITIKKYGVSRIIRIQLSNNVHSFVYGFLDANIYKSSGDDADKEEIMQFLLNKFKKE